MDKPMIAWVYPIAAIIAISLLNYSSLFGFFSYSVNISLFTIIGISGYYLIKRYNYLIIDRKIIVISLVSAVIQIFVNISLAFFTGFGKSPYITTYLGMINNILFFTSNLFGIELLRFYLILNIKTRNVLRKLIAISILMSMLSLSLPTIVTLKTPLNIFSYLGAELLSTLSQNGLATVLAYTGGPLASIAYRGTIVAFEWLSPLLPDFPWVLKTVLGVSLPILGLFVFQESLGSFFLVRKGLQDRGELRLSKKKVREDGRFLIVVVITVLLIWGSLGLLGFKPMVVVSGSMIPALNIGDLAITVNSAPEEISKGDIISYFREELSAPVIHRVVKISSNSGDTLIVTKGDANNAEDTPFSAVSRDIFKTVLIIPKIGIISIFIKEQFQTVFNLAENNSSYSIVALGVIMICVTSTYIFYSRQPRLRLRRRLGR